MFNNTKYKIKEEIHNPIVINSSELYNKDLENNTNSIVDSDQIYDNKNDIEINEDHQINNYDRINNYDQINIFTSYIIEYKSKPLYKKILTIHTLIKVIINFIKSI